MRHKLKLLVDEDILTWLEDKYPEASLSHILNTILQEFQSAVESDRDSIDIQDISRYL